MDLTPLYPLLFRPIYKQKVWGGRQLEKLGRTLPNGPATPIGESWEVVDLASTSVSGGGGDAERSVIANGPLAGRTLHEVMAVHGQRFMGRLLPADDGGFPILIKFLDAQEHLSVQVHPSPAYARAHPEANLKSEAWYIVDAAPGAAIYKGVREGVTPEQFRAAINASGPDAAKHVEELMIRVPVKAGDCHYLPSGTCHALGAGILVAEVQTPSDTTFRVFDWGRTGRELHIEQAMACIEFGPPNVRRHERRSHISGVFTTVTRLVLCDFFRIEKVRMTESYSQEIPYDQPAIWMVLEGAGRIRSAKNSFEPVSFTRGQTLLLPAGMDEPHIELARDTVWLEVTFPKAQPEPIA
ncbi:MAG: class I mannose-6-phosphate isomerase [Planctomycetota bacterium]|nr:class I mannose-6-phosphate isomerase [Planctomycetota bacterium]